MAGDANVIGRSITLDGVPHTIMGVLPNLPFSWIGPNAEIWTTKPFVIPGLSFERMMRGSGFLRVVGRLKPGITIAQARAALPPLEQSYRAQYPDKIDSSSVMTLKTLPEDVTGNLRSAFAVQWPSPRELAAHGARGIARECVAAFYFRKLAREPARRSRRHCGSVATGAARSANGGEFSPVRSRDWREPFASRARVHNCLVDFDRSRHGHLSGMAKFARRSG